MWERYTPDLDDKNRIPVGNNSLLVRSDGKTLLLDTGVGDKADARTRRHGHRARPATSSQPRDAGVRPDEIDFVVNTHLHFDHCGGNTVDRRRQAGPRLPRARYFIQKGEWEAATHPNERTRGTYLAENFEPLADAKQVELIEGEIEVVTGVRIVPRRATPRTTASSS